MAVDRIADELVHGGWLFVLRNRIPFALIAEQALQYGGVLHFGEEQIVQHVQGLLKRGQAMRDYGDSVTVILPEKVGTYFVKEKALLLPTWRTPSGGKPSPKILRLAWEQFLRSWMGSGGLRFFGSEGESGCHPKTAALCAELEKKEGRRLRVGTGERFVNVLPDVWICLTYELRRQEKIAQGGREEVERYLVQLALDLSTDVKAVTDQLERWLRDEQLLIVKLSGATLNPRFRGWRIEKAEFARPLIVHGALVYGRSRVQRLQLGIPSQGRTRKGSPRNTVENPLRT